MNVFLTLRCTAVLAVILWPATWASGQQPKEAPNNVLEQPSSSHLLKYLEDFVGHYVFAFFTESGESLLQESHPLLHYTNPVQNGRGAGCTWLWLDGNRPLAALSLSIRHTGEVMWEAAALTDPVVICGVKAKDEWTARETGVLSQPIPNAPEVAVSVPLRLAQMRRLAQRFHVSKGNSDLRLLTQLLHRSTSASTEAGEAADGGLFAFAEATDPGMLLLIEVVSDRNGGHEWLYTLARMSSQLLTVKPDGVLVLETDLFWNAPSRKLPYVEARAGLYDFESALSADGEDKE